MSFTSFACLRPHRLAWPRTPAFQAGNTGSNPVGDTRRFYPRDFPSNPLIIRPMAASPAKRKVPSLSCDSRMRDGRSFPVQDLPCLSRMSRRE